MNPHGLVNSSPPEQQLTERCRMLGLPVWHWNGAGRTTDVATGWGDAEAWLHAAPLREMLERAVGDWSAGDAEIIIELVSGCRLIVVTETRPGGPTVPIVTALALGPDLFADPVYERICVAAGLDPAVTRTTLEPLARWGGADLGNQAAVLQWMLDDLRRDAEGQQTIENFSSQLVDVYEHMNLLYRIGELMHGLEDAHGFVQMAIELLQSTLEFGWVGVRFATVPSLGRSLTNELVLAGEAPCSYERFDRLTGALAAELAERLGTDVRPEVLNPGANELATFVDSEIFVNPLLCDNQSAGVLIAGNKLGEEPAIDTIDMQLLSATSDYMSVYLHNASLFAEQRATFLGVVKALSASIDAKDQYTQGHSERVAHLAAQLAAATGTSRDEVDHVRLAGTLHDIGKIGVPEAVLLKPGKLTEAEYEKIKQHPTIGYNILKDIEPLQDVLPGVLYHHERWDGRGYPHGLKGLDIPILGRILAVADAFDAMSSDRSYRPRMDRARVLQEMRNGAGVQWDADLISVFLSLDLSKYDAMIDRHASQRVA